MPLPRSFSWIDLLPGSFLERSSNPWQLRVGLLLHQITSTKSDEVNDSVNQVGHTPSCSGELNLSILLSTYPASQNSGIPKLVAFKTNSLNMHTSLESRTIQHKNFIYTLFCIAQRILSTSQAFKQWVHPYRHEANFALNGLQRTSPKP